MKNTVGYGLNAFVDYEHPLDIFAHLLIGAEGTLAFISEAVLHTIPDLPYKSASMLYFRNIYEACNAIAHLKEAGAEALELMDDNALKSVAHLKGLPGFFQQLPSDCAALLCEFQADSQAALEHMIQKAVKLCNGFGLLHPPAFTKTEAERQFYWKIRKGMFPSVGAVRKRGTTVILEDIAFPVEDLAYAILDLHHLFKKFDYQNAIIFGHAKEGNIHFVITQLLDSEAEIARYDAFMRAVVDMVLHKYGGALKAEHGTGRNMAPFVEAEWGGEAYRIMEELKQTVDPAHILNPGVIINPDKQAHIKNLKHLPEVEQEVDKCIECGFCEHHCPSKDVTLTPRQRIQVRRHLESMKHSGHTKQYGELLGQYKYAGLDTCATDGLCQLDCPVDINTGELVKRLRSESHHSLANGIAKRIAQNFGLAEKMVILALKSGQFIDSIFGSKAMYGFTSIMQKLVRSMPVWWPEMPKPPKWNAGLKDAPDFIYLSACIQRMMGHDEEARQCAGCHDDRK
jgi:D-lactate dehydrogenase